MIQRSVISSSNCPPSCNSEMTLECDAGEWKPTACSSLLSASPRVSYQCHVYICLWGFTCVITRSFMCFYTPLNSVKLTAQNRNTINCVALQTYLSESYYDGVKWKKNAVSETGESCDVKLEGNWRSSRWSLALQGEVFYERPPFELRIMQKECLSGYQLTQLIHISHCLSNK